MLRFLFPFYLRCLWGCFQHVVIFLVLSRTIVFFPFFLLGFHFKESFFDNPHPVIYLLAGAILVVSALVIFVYYNKIANYLKIVYGNSSYSSLGYNDVSGLLLRLFWYVLSVIMVLSFFYVIPRRRFQFTYIGERTLGIYIVHRLIRDIVQYLGVYNYLGRGWKLLIYLAIISLLTVFITSRKCISDQFNKLYQGKFPAAYSGRTFCI